MSDDMMTGVSSEGGQETIIFVILNLPEADEGSLKLNLRDSSVASGDLRMTIEKTLYEFVYTAIILYSRTKSHLTKKISIVERVSLAALICLG